MTNHWIDIKNSDCILIMGSNAAENHPISFKYVTEAQQNGATLISVDPRFTRTSSKADIYTALRSGTDIAFLGGMIKYILDNDLYQKEYVALYTNAPFIVGPSFDSDRRPLFRLRPQDPHLRQEHVGLRNGQVRGAEDRTGPLRDPRSVFQLLKKHYSRYNTRLVSEITGTPEKDLLKVYKTYGATGANRQGRHHHVRHGLDPAHRRDPEHPRHGHHPAAPGQHGRRRRRRQRAAGRVERPGLHRPLPSVPHLARLPENPAGLGHLAGGLQRQKHPHDQRPTIANWWQNHPKYSVSLLKSFFGEKAEAGNEFGYGWLPKLEDGKNYSWLDLFDGMHKGSIKGFFAWGQNPACSGANANKTRAALKNLDWMVNINLFDNETGSFWKGPGMDPAAVKTEVFFLPACASVEKEGSITNCGRWMQWRYQGRRPLGSSLSDGDIILKLGEKLKELHAKEPGVFPDALLSLKWDYATAGEYDPHKVAKEINGYFLKDVTIKDKTSPRRHPGAEFCLPADRTAPPPRPTGSIATATPTKATWPPAAARKTRPTASASIRNCPGAGRSTAASFTTARRSTPRAIPGTRDRWVI